MSYMSLLFPLYTNFSFVIMGSMSPKQSKKSTRKTSTKRAKDVVEQAAPVEPSKTMSFERLHERFPNFLLGLTVVIILLVIFSFLFDSTKQGGNDAKAGGGIFNLFGGGGDEATEEEAEPESIATTYTVKEGDHLWSIAEEIYGSGENAYDIAEANELVEPFYLEAGQELVIPKVEAMAPTVGDVPITATPALDKTQMEAVKYTVKAGDNLSTIALAHYGSLDLWNIIWDANKDTLPSPEGVEIGQVLTLPPHNEK